MSYIELNCDNIGAEHICCAFSDRKCAEGYALKKEWLAGEFEKGYVFRRLDERAKVFIEYGPAEEAWLPVEAPGYLALGCFWVSGRYKKSGHGKELLQSALDDAAARGKKGLIAVAGRKKNHFMSDGKWLMKQGFEICDETADGFLLISLKTDREDDSPAPRFRDQALSGETPEKEEFVVYYSNRCPFTEYHIKTSLAETAAGRNLDIKIIKLNSAAEAQSAPTAAGIFSLYRNGRLLTTDLSVCMDSRFDRIVKDEKS